VTTDFGSGRNQDEEINQELGDGHRNSVTARASRKPIPVGCLARENDWWKNPAARTEALESRTKISAEKNKSSALRKIRLKRNDFFIAIKQDSYNYGGDHPLFIIKIEKLVHDSLSNLINKNKARRSVKYLHPSMILFIGSSKKLKCPYDLIQ
jgi:hypothetical protein